MIEFLVVQIKLGKIKLEDLPLKYYDEVKARLEKGDDSNA